MASNRDRRAADLHRAGLPYSDIAARLGFPDARAAHRGVARALAEPAEDGAQVRGLRQAEHDRMLGELTGRLWQLLDDLDPDSREWRRTFDSLYAVTDRRCKLAGLYVHPWRCDQWWRNEVPSEVYLTAQLDARVLERATRIPERSRARKSQPRPMAEVLELRTARPVIDSELVPAPVQKLLVERAA